MANPGPTPEQPAVLRLSAFARDGAGGNPAGVVLDARALDEQQMRALAEQVGYSETVFVTDGPPEPGRRHYRVRYFSPLAEVPFCGHATVALGAALGSVLGGGDLELDTAAGPVAVRTGQHPSGEWWARLASVPPRQRQLPAELLQRALDCFGWSTDVLEPGLPPMLCYAGAWHLVLNLADRAELEAMSYDFAALQALCSEQDWTTVSVMYQVSPQEYLARNPFPVGGVVEDPATGAAAAAYGGYLAALGVVRPPVRLRILQGEQIGRPSELAVELHPDQASVWVTGTVRPISEPDR
ncbi:PhzF family phenazine biosynthesis protein [Jatrophihabitans sp.]|uniref:PhzF family phenazine biosynthesis protein n=1 Tax=Jatrophihabitans sp. TaxID=1932789 RepID=UPI002C7AB64D|nr:PhzF family phenazine biosynthesis isomerase [Jatrophihabitans sp.]